MPRPRAKFVWLPEQAFDHAAQFTQIRNTPPRREAEGQNRWILARGTFVLDSSAGPAGLNFTSDGRFRLWLNGSYLGGGPVRSHPSFLRYSRFDIAPGAVEGTNLLAALIYLPGRDLAWYETAKGGWQPVFGDGGILAEIEGRAGGSPIAWNLLESDAWRRDTANCGWGQNAIEALDANLLPPDWLQAEFDDSAWSAARIMRAEPDAEVKARGWGAVEPFPHPVASATAPLAEYEVAASRLHWVKPVFPRPDLGLRERLYAEQLGEALSLPTSPENFHLATGPEAADVAVMTSFDPYRVGRPFVEFTALGGETIELAADEAVPGEFGLGREGDGLRVSGQLWVAHVASYRARAGRQRFEWFHPTGVRALQLVLRDAPAGVTIHRIGLIACHHDTPLDGQFSSGEDLLDTLWQRGRHTVLMCAQDGWLDCPGRESRQWLGDGVVMFDMAAYAMGTGIYPLHRQFFDQVAEGQRADGLARMVAPGDIPPTITIPDYTLLWLIGIERFLSVTGDLGAVEKWTPAAEKALAWIERAADDDGLIADVPEWHFIEWADLGREGWSLPFNALCVGALDAMARVGRRLEREGLSASCARLAGTMRGAINRLHWDDDRGLYVDSVDPADGSRKMRASQHGNALTLLFDIAPAERAASVLHAITDRARLRLTDAPPIVMADAPLDEAAHLVRANSFFSHFVYDAIARSGRFDWVVEEIRTLYGPMIASGATTIWESFAPVASLCHGFSATPVYLLSRYGLGIEPTEPGYAGFAVADHGGLVGEVSGTVPTTFGPIQIRWSEAETGRLAEMRHPAQCRPSISSSARCVEAQFGQMHSRVIFRRS